MYSFYSQVHYYSSTYIACYNTTIHVLRTSMAALQQGSTVADYKPLHYNQL